MVSFCDARDGEVSICEYKRMKFRSHTNDFNDNEMELCCTHFKKSYGNYMLV